MKFGVVIFPGSNCDHDAVYALSGNLGQRVTEIWHESEDLGDVDAVFLPGGFSYGDYLRCGAIARFSPVIRSVRNFARSGGFGDRGLQRLPDPVRDGSPGGSPSSATGACGSSAGPWTWCPEPRIRRSLPNCRTDRPLRIPIAHGEGCYIADDATLDRLEAEDRVALSLPRRESKRLPP